MDNPAVHFGKLLYWSELPPAQISQKVRQLTTPKKWLRNPFADFPSPFEGTVSADGFELVYLTRIRADRTVPGIKASITTDDIGKTVVLIRLEKTLGSRLWNLMLVGISAFFCLLTITEHNFFCLMVAFLIAGLRWFRHIPDQFLSRQILNLLQQRLQLISFDSTPAA